MKRNNFGFWVCVITVCILGVLSHYAYEWSGGNEIVGLVSPKNESVSEHLKLLWFPFLLCSAVEFLWYGHNVRGFVFSRLVGLLSGLLFIPVMFYLYTSIFGQNFVAVDITIFLISVWLSFYVSEKVLAMK